MSDFNIRDKCSINTNKDSDTFVGVCCNNGDVSVHFPLGFHLSENDRELRKEILLLMTTIKEITGKKDSSIDKEGREYNRVAFPFQAYLSIIYDYYARGYYIEKETSYDILKLRI